MKAKKYRKKVGKIILLGKKLKEKIKKLKDNNQNIEEDNEMKQLFIWYPKEYINKYLENIYEYFLIIIFKLNKNNIIKFNI